MSCDNSIPLQTIVDQVRTALESDFITQDNPTIVNGVFTTPVLNSPSIRGDILFDAAARQALRFAVNTTASEVPEVVGSRSDSTALASLLTALATAGLIVDSTTT